MKPHHLEKLRELASSFGLIRSMDCQEAAAALYAALDELESRIELCDCGADDVGDVLHATTCLSAAVGGEAGGA